jgi:hypothetical protein
MKLKELFKSYYKPWFIGGFCLFGFRFLLDSTNEENYLTQHFLEGIFVIISLGSLIGLTCGGVYHWFYEVYRPKKNAKLFEEIEYLNFTNYGLSKIIEENCFAGHYKKYYIIIIPDIDTEGRKWIKIKVFIKVTDEMVSNSKSILKQIDINQVENGFNWAEQKIKLNSKEVQEEDKIINELDKVIDILVMNNIEADEIHYF